MISKVIAAFLFTMSVFFLSMASLAYYKLHNIKPKISEPAHYGSIVRLVRDDRTFCSGTVVNETTVLTAGHCMLIPTILGETVNTEPIEIRAKDDISRKTFGRINTMSPQMDWAVLKGNFKIYNYRTVITDVETLNNKRDKTAEFISCGYPMAGNLFCTPVHYLYREDFMWAVEGLLLPGMSGGPVIDSEGNVIAINHAVHNEHSIVSPTYNLDKEF